MTAINLFTQGAAAYLLTDGALVALDGELLAIENKVVALPDLHLAICITGFGVADFGADNPDGVSNGRVLAALADTGVLTADGHGAAMALLPQALRNMHLGNLTSFAGELDAEERSSILMTVAAWDPGDGTAKAYVGSTEPMGQHAAYALARVRQYLTAPAAGLDPAEMLRAAVGRQVDIGHPASFDVRRDGLRLLDAQRSIKGGPCGGDYHSVGGKAFLTIVSAAGAATEELHTWPEDRVGERINPFRLAA